MNANWPEGIRLDPDICRRLRNASIRIDSVGYPVAVVDGKRVRLHRFVAGVPAGFEVDHINRNKLDCRRANLRKATHQQNSCNSGRRSHNTSGYRGVYLCKQTGRWRAEIRAHARAYKLGRFDTPTAAAQAYDTAARRMHGEFATTNQALGLLP